ncbi:amino acid permease [uncultured Limosilactobacillus sp.]|uniref:amino acid permease n=1 Tax=uncultured Limosilactobacillus sp. TaxID=2837629 RepID=UPI0025F8A85C|nr:amino acid permease [uncultured Limosilactobacillus sp.]
MSKQKYKYTLMTFVGVTMAIVANVRNIPTLAATGWSGIFYLLLSLLIFVIPLVGIINEFGSTFPGAGGPQLWAKESLGAQMGFVIAFVEWAQMFPGLIMVTSTLGPLTGQIFGQSELANNHWFMFGAILVSIWGMSLLSLKFDIQKIGGDYGVYIGVYIPAIMLLILGIMTMFKVGINVHSYLGSFSTGKLIPSFTDKQTLSYVGAIMFLFTGIEMSSVYIPELKDSKHNYARGVIISVIFILCLNMFNGLLVSNIIPMGKIQLSNVAQAILLDCEALGLPTWIANIFSACVVVGVILQLASWINSPQHSVSTAAKQGAVPAKWGWFKTNKYGVCDNLIWVQLIILTLLAFLYAFIKNVNQMFLALTNATSIIDFLIYAIFGISILVLRKKRPDLPRPNRLGKRGNGLAWLCAAMMWISCLFVIYSTLMSSNLVSIIIIAVIVVACFLIPIWIFKCQKPSWRTEAEQWVQSHKNNN